MLWLQLPIRFLQVTGFGFTASEEEGAGIDAANTGGKEDPEEEGWGFLDCFFGGFDEGAGIEAANTGGKEDPEDEGWGFLDCFFGGFDLPSPASQRDCV